MRAGGTAAKRGSLATRSTSARSAGLKACAGIGRTACGLPSPSCLANGIDGYRYLRVLLIELPKAKTAEDFDALLPRRLVPAQT